MTLALRFLMAASLATSSISHAFLYLHGYGQVPVVGPGFLLQASVLAALAVLIALGANRTAGVSVVVKVNVACCPTGSGVPATHWIECAPVALMTVAVQPDGALTGVGVFGR